ncbi:SDR family NAD(P)-dependent oxidoreductase [Cypionkella sp.]|uniref:SDR family NAD(P)-dependent oxidoreductase n=1 Tax=Cypionkella sp. TaxID=2811411 RepID=UPI003752A2DD
MTVLITGANRGIGAGLLAHYRSKGEVCFGTARKASDGLLPLDVTDPAACAALGQHIDAPLDLLICNAGVYLDRDQDLTGYAPELWADSFATNVTGVFLTLQALLPQLRAAKGKIAIISSQMASDTRAPGGSYIYRASKAAVLNLGRNLSADLAPEGIAVGIYHPGWVQTDMGGAAASISVAQSVAGLTRCFEALSLQNTGCFLNYDGSVHPY